MNFNINSLSALHFVILAIAAARVTRLVVEDAIADRPRKWLLRRFPNEGQYVDGPAPKGAHWRTQAINSQPVRWVVTKGSFVGELISCPWCVGFWIGCAWVAAWWQAPQGTLFFALPWAVANVASFVTTKE